MWRVCYEKHSLDEEIGQPELVAAMQLHRVVMKRLAKTGSLPEEEPGPTHEPDDSSISTLGAASATGFA